MASLGRPRPGLSSQWEKAVILLAWTVGRPLLSGLWGGGGLGVCVRLLPILQGGIPWKTEKGRGSDVCGEVSSLANEVLGRAQSSPSWRSPVLSAAGRFGLPGGDLNGLVPVCIQNGSTLQS